MFWKSFHWWRKRCMIWAIKEGICEDGHWAQTTLRIAKQMRWWEWTTFMYVSGFISMISEILVGHCDILSYIVYSWIREYYFVVIS
jgi:hypothetical protein